MLAWGNHAKVEVLFTTLLQILILPSCLLFQYLLQTNNLATFFWVVVCSISVVQIKNQHFVFFPSVRLLLNIMSCVFSSKQVRERLLKILCLSRDDSNAKVMKQGGSLLANGHLIPSSVTDRIRTYINSLAMICIQKC